MRKGRVALALLLVAVACNRGDAHQSTKAEPPPLCPLSGLRAEREFPVDRPALAVKIDNAAQARPQAGLDAADVVYEELAEGGITRFMAIFHCADAAKVGPVRSARMVDPDILIEYRPVLLGYSGANPEVLSKVRSAKGVEDLRYSSHGASYDRKKGRPAPHDLFTSTDALRELSGTLGRQRTGFVFREPGTREAATPSPGKASASPPPPLGKSISFSFAGGVLTRYDFSEGVYLRSVSGKPFLIEGGSQLKTTNVVVMMVKVVDGHIRDAAGNYSPEISVIGSGEAYVLTNGRATNARWVRRSLSDHTRLVDSAGRDVPLAPGNTWIHLLPSDRAVTLG